MKFHFPTLLMLIILSCPESTLKAQENREPDHSCFRLDAERIIPLEMDVQPKDPNLFRSQFMFMKEWSGKQVFVKIPGWVVPYSIRINGFRFGSDPGSGVYSEYNITPFLNKQSNILDLHAELIKGPIDPAHLKLGTLMIRDAIHVRDLVIETHPGTEENEILVRFHLFLKSYLEEKNQGCNIQLTVTGPGNAFIFQEIRELNAPLSFGQETEMIIDHTLTEPLFWLPGAPAYYEVKLTMGEKPDESLESIFTQFVIRSSPINDSLYIQHGDSVRLVYASGELARNLTQLPETKVSEIVSELGINAIRSENPLPCRQEELFIRTGILVITGSE
ncbi:MAG: hypothetical protein R6W31_13645 [Bacteroidales bacterium]